MIEITQELKGQFSCKVLGVALFSAFQQLAVAQVHGYAPLMMLPAKD